MLAASWRAEPALRSVLPSHTRRLIIVVLSAQKFRLPSTFQQALHFLPLLLFQRFLLLLSELLLLVHLVLVEWAHDEVLRDILKAVAIIDCEGQRLERMSRGLLSKHKSLLLLSLHDSCLLLKLGLFGVCASRLTSVVRVSLRV